jgi:hypothetical protein
VASTNQEAGGEATLIAIEAPEITRQKKAIHIVLVILDPKPASRKAPASRNKMGTDLQDRIRAARWLANANLESGERNQRYVSV